MWYLDKADQDKYINFLIYYNRKMIFHKSVDILAKYYDTIYIGRLLKTVIEEIRTKYIIQLVTDNWNNFKWVKGLIKANHPRIIWTSTAAYYIALMMKDIREIDIVKNIMKAAQTVTWFIYNHRWVHAKM